MKTVKIGVYGTLKKGFHNHYLLGENPKRLEDKRVNGLLTQFKREAFPRLFMSLAHTTLVEVYKIKKSDFEEIKKLENAFKYFERKIDDIYIFYSELPKNARNLREIKTWPVE